MEVYGEKPKRFTKDWWDYVWMYYKWHIIATIVVVFMLVITLQQCTNRPEYDLRITVATENLLADMQTDKIEELAEKVILDATGNGENEVFISALSTSDKGSAEVVQAQATKLSLEFVAPESYVFILPESYMDIAIDSGIIESAEVWAGDMENDGYSVSLKGNEYLKKLGIDTESQELFMGVGALYGDKTEDELEKLRHENGIKFARHLVGLE